MRMNITLYFFFILSLLFITDSKSQISIQGTYTTLKGQIIHQETGKPIAFVNVGFIGKGVGSVTDSNGFFVLKYSTEIIKPSDIIQFSIIGYKTIKTSIGSINTILSTNNRIKLTPELYSLEEVVIGGTQIKKTTIGNGKINPDKFGYWKNELGLGGEIATKIRIKKEKTQLLNLNLTVLENLSDSIRVRVNIYDIDPIYRIPKTNILNTVIYHTISRKRGLERIPLSDYGIYTDTDVIASIELVEIYGNKLGFAVAGSANKNPSFTRSISLDYWKPHKSEAMGFTMDVSYPLKKSDNDIVDRVLPESVTIFWDASATAKARNLKADIDLIDRYIKTIKNVDVTVQKFAFGYLESKEFTIKRGKTAAIINYLENTDYEGIVDYSSIEELPSDKTQVNVLFTDGNAPLSRLEPVFSNSVFAIANSTEANTSALEEVALYTDGAYINLHNHTPKKALPYLLNYISNESSLEEEVQDLSKIKGKILSEIGVIEGATVRLKGTFREVKSDASGEFEIAAQEGDYLSIRFPGMKTKEIQISNTSVSITMEVSGDWLDEVVLTGKGKEEEKFVETATGNKNFDAIGYKSKVITSEDIKTGYLSLGDVLRTQSNIVVSKDVQTGEDLYIIPRTFYSSVFNPLYPVVVIDGTIYTQQTGRSNNIPAIDLQTISSISITSSLIAVTQYGSIAAGGAIVIKTKIGGFESGISKVEKQPSALIEGNDYLENVTFLEDKIDNTPYSMQLEKSQSLQEAIDFYNRYRSNSIQNPIEFYSDVASYFKKWDKKIASRILSNLLIVAPENVEVLKLMAYHMESLGDMHTAIKIYEKIKDVAPDRIQSYRDLALIYQDNGKYTEAFNLYKQMLANDTEGLDFTPLKKTIEYELLRLLAFHKSKVNYEDLPNSLLDVGFKKDRRLVFEWTDTLADFEIQFVNPQAKYFEWSHTALEDRERLEDELRNGYSLEEFGLDEAPPGEWLINIQYLGEEGIQPPAYLKYTVYLNYATLQETKEVKIIKLFKQQDKTTLGTLTLN